MMAASKLSEAHRLIGRWTSESASDQVSATTTSTGKATAHARSASTSTAANSSGSSKTTSGGSRRSARTTASTNSDARKSTVNPSGTATTSRSGRTVGTVDSTTGSLGPSSIPSSGPSSGHDITSDSTSSGLTSGARTAIIVATVIGGLLILAILLILLLRLFRKKKKKKKSPRIADDPYLRPPSTTTFLSTKTRDANLTALPMYRERRRQLAAADNGASKILPDMQELYKHDPRLQDVWKTANPPTPITERFPADVEGESIQLRPPEMAQVRGASAIARLSSHDDADFNPAESIYAPSAIDLEAGVWPHTPLSEDDFRGRWSWSTSYATAKSKAGAQSLASTIASLPAVRRVREWIADSSDGHREPPLIREGDAGPSRTNSVTFLKNKATKPNLAPLPTQELSRRQLESDQAVSTNDQGSMPAKQRKDSDGVLEAIDAVVPDDGVIS